FDLKTASAFSRHARSRTQKKQPPAPAGAGPRQRWDQVAAGHAFGLRAALPAHCPHHADTVGDAERGGLQHGPELLVYARSPYELGVDRGDDLGWSTLGHHPLDGS